MSERYTNAVRNAKGLPDLGREISLQEIGSRGWNLLAEDLPLPAAVLRTSALENNRRWMREFLARTGASIAPHGKTTMSPQLFAMQMDDGAWALTLATMRQVRVARDAGVRRILLANEIVGPHDFTALFDELQRDPAFEFYCLVDSQAGLRRMIDAATARKIGRPVRLLIEIGYSGGRAGCRDLDLALTLAREIKAAGPCVQLAGIEGFEGLHSVGDGAAVRAFLERIAEAARRIDAAQLFDTNEVILTAGGSAFYDLVVEIFSGVTLSRPTRLVLRSGCYLTHDTGLYERSFRDVRERSQIARAIEGRFENALEVWVHVLSVPEPQRAILGAGRRDFGHDSGLPRPLRHFRPGRDSRPAVIEGWELVAVNDQHAHLVMPAGADIEVGDLVALGPSHPCTTFDKWPLLCLVDDDYRICGAVHTSF